MDVDRLLRSLGKFGRFQMLQYIYNLSCFPMMAFPLVIYVFIGHIPDFRCKFLGDDDSYTNTNTKLNNSRNVTFQFNQCDVTVTTNLSGTVVKEIVSCRAEYEFSGQQTVASEWGLVCEDEGLGGMTTTLLVVGQMVGASVFPTLADKHGRLLIAYTTLMAVIVCFLLTAIVPWFAGFVVMRFLMGMLSQGPGIILPTLGLELFPTELRGFVISSGSVAWALSLSIIPLVAFLLRHVTWRYTMGAAALFGIHSFFTKWFLQESPRWLLVNNKFDEAKIWIQKAAKCNKKDPTSLLSELDSIKENAERENSDVILEQTAEMAGKLEEVMGSESTQVSVLEIFRHKHLLVASIVVWMLWFVNSLTYYGLFLTSGTMSGNMYLNFFLNSVVEIPSVILYSLTINRWGRRKTCAMFLSTAGVSLLLSGVLTFVGESNLVRGFAMTFSFTGKFGISGAWMTACLFTPEIYPTNIRAQGLGLASLAARVGGMISPYATMFGSRFPWGPPVVFGSFAVLGTILLIWIPETTGKELPNTVEDVKRLYTVKQIRSDA